VLVFFRLLFAGFSGWLTFAGFALSALGEDFIVSGSASIWISTNGTPDMSQLFSGTDAGEVAIWEADYNVSREASASASIHPSRDGMAIDLRVFSYSTSIVAKAQASVSLDTTQRVTFRSMNMESGTPFYVWITTQYRGRVDAGLGHANAVDGIAVPGELTGPPSPPPALIFFGLKASEINGTMNTRVVQRTFGDSLLFTSHMDVVAKSQLPGAPLPGTNAFYYLSFLRNTYVDVDQEGVYAVAEDGRVLASPARLSLIQTTRQNVISLSAITPGTYVLESSDDLLTWQPVSTNAVAYASSVTLTNAAAGDHRFFRGLFQPQ
jgi:hypothetical protein